LAEPVAPFSRAVGPLAAHHKVPKCGPGDREAPRLVPPSSRAPSSGRFWARGLTEVAPRRRYTEPVSQKRVGRSRTPGRLARRGAGCCGSITSPADTGLRVPRRRLIKNGPPPSEKRPTESPRELSTIRLVLRVRPRGHLVEGSRRNRDRAQPRPPFRTGRDPIPLHRTEPRSAGTLDRRPEAVTEKDRRD